MSHKERDPHICEEKNSILDTRKQIPTHRMCSVNLVKTKTMRRLYLDNKFERSKCFWTTTYT